MSCIDLLDILCNHEKACGVIKTWQYYYDSQYAWRTPRRDMLRAARERANLDPEAGYDFMGQELHRLSCVQLGRYIQKNCIRDIAAMAQTCHRSHAQLSPLISEFQDFTEWYQLWFTVSSMLECEEVESTRVKNVYRHGTWPYRVLQTTEYPWKEFLRRRHDSADNGWGPVISREPDVWMLYQHMLHIRPRYRHVADGAR